MMLAEAELLRQAGRWEDVLQACRGIRERAGRIDWLAGPAMADRLESGRAFAAGDAHRAEELARASAAGFRAIGAEWEAAVAGLDHAEALRALRRDADASAALERAAPALRRARAVRELARLATLSGG
jgi:hypothetical protein